MTKLSTLDFAKIQDNIDEFPGFYIQARSTRAYTAKAGANAIGYVSEISKTKLLTVIKPAFTSKVIISVKVELKLTTKNFSEDSAVCALNYVMSMA